MAFPTGTSNGQTTTINGAVFVYSASDNAWTRISTPFGNLAINNTLTANIGVILGNLYANANIIAGNVNSNTSTVGTLIVSTASISSGTTQQDVLNLNNNNLYGVNTIRINDPGTSEGIVWEGGSGWYIYESPNDLSNNTGNLQIVRNNVRTLTVDTFGGINIPNTIAATSTTSGALTVGGGVGIGGNLWVAGNIYAANLISIGSYTINVQDPLLYLTAPSLGSYNYDIGLYSQFIGGSLNIYQHTGLARNYTNNTWGLFSNVQSEPGTTINWADAGLIWDTLKVGAVSIANTTTSTSTSTGALVVSGGAGIAGTLNVGGNITVGNVISSTYYSAGGASRFALSDIGIVSISVASQEYKFGASGIEASPGIFGGTYGGNKLSLNNETALISNRYDAVTIQTGTDGSTQNTWTFGNSALTTPGNITAGGNVAISATTASTNFSTGALVVAGGAAIAGSAYVNKLYSTQGLYWSGNGIAISTGGGGGGSPGGSFGALQFNNGGSFDGSSIIYDNVSGNLVITDTTDSTSTTTGALVVKGGVGIAGNLTVAGNVKIGTPLSYTPLNAPVTIGYSINGYSQFAIQNTNTGNNASTDIAAIADNGNDNDTYIDVGILSSTYSQAGYSIYHPNDGYVIVAGNTVINGGNLVLSTTTAKDIIFATYGQNVNNEVMRITSGNVVNVKSTVNSTSNVTGALVVAGGLGVAGNVYANTVYTSTGIRWAGNGVAFSSGSGTGLTYTAATVPPTTGNVKGDQWYNTTTDVLYEYINDGTTSYWVDVQSLGTSTGNAVTVSFNDLTLGGNIILTSNLIYSIGGSTGQLKFIYAGNIIGVTANVATINTGNIVALSNITAANITASANVQGNYMLGNGSKLTGITATSIGAATTGKAIAMAIVFGG